VEVRGLVVEAGDEARGVADRAGAETEAASDVGEVGGGARAELAAPQLGALVGVGWRDGDGEHGAVAELVAQIDGALTIAITGPSKRSS
jgi:hypothetical protein